MVVALKHEGWAQQQLSLPAAWYDNVSKSGADFPISGDATAIMLGCDRLRETIATSFLHDSA